MRGRLGFQLALTNEGADARGCREETRKRHAPAKARKGARPKISMQSLIARYHLHPILTISRLRFWPRECSRMSLVT